MKHAWLRQVIILLLCSTPLLPAPACAAEKIVNAAGIAEEPLTLTGYFSVLEDPSSSLTLADVQQPEIGSRFSAVESSASQLNFSYTKSTYWLRLELDNPGAHPLDQLLEISNARLADVKLYGAPQSKEKPLASGFAIPFAQRAYSHRYIVFPLQIPANTRQTVYLRVQSLSPLEIPAQLWNRSAYLPHERNDYLMQAVYFGMVLAMFLYNLMLFVSLSDVRYLFYLVYVSTHSMSLASTTGMGMEYLWDGHPYWSLVSRGFLSLIAMSALLLLMRNILSLRRTAPRLDKLVIFTMAVNLLIALGYIYDYQSFLKPLFALFLINPLLFLVVTFYCIHKKQHGAGYFLAAYFVVAVAIVITTLRISGFLPHNIITVNGVQFGSALEMIILAFALADRIRVLRNEKEKAQAAAMEIQSQLVETLQTSEQRLEERVEQRTQELQGTLQHLRTTQTQLIQTEKMASLGLLVASVAHEINTPIASVKSSGESIADAIGQLRGSTPEFETIDLPTRRLFARLLDNVVSRSDLLSSREERAIVREVAAQLEAAGIDQAESKARLIVQLNGQSAVTDFLQLLHHPQCDLLLRRAESIAAISSCTANINTAVERVSKIVFALKSFARVDKSGKMVEANLHEGIDTVLAIYQSQIRQGIELVKHYEHLPPLRCLPDELNQVWTNLIHNALQAMGRTGTLTVTVRREGNQAVVSIGDTGCGIPSEIRNKIFDAFFTTKPAGEGSGLGLDIVKLIVEKHHGHIEVQSEVGVGSTFVVYLPLDSAA